MILFCVDILKYLRENLDRIETAALKLKAKNCQLFSKKVIRLSTQIIQVDMMKEWPTPSNVTELRSFVGHFVLDFAKPC